MPCVTTTAINPDYGTKEDFKRLDLGSSSPRYEGDHRHRRESHFLGQCVDEDILSSTNATPKAISLTPTIGSTLPHLITKSQELRRYMTDMLKYWIREFDLDGFRCDVAGEVPTDFWENARAELDKIKPDIVMLAEAHKAELLVKAFDLRLFLAAS